MDVQAWTTGVNFGSSIGVHTMRLCRFKERGPVFTQLDDLGDIFTLPKAEIRESSKQTNGYFSESRPEVLAVLRSRGFMGNAVTCVKLVTIAAARQVLKRMDVDAHALDVLKALASSEPPPRPPAPVQRCANCGRPPNVAHA